MNYFALTSPLIDDNESPPVSTPSRMNDFARHFRPSLICSAKTYTSITNLLYHGAITSLRKIIFLKNQLDVMQNVAPLL